MRLHRFLVVAVTTLSLAPVHAAVASPAYSDIICPRAVPEVVDFMTAGATNDPAKIAAASRAAAEAYQLCASAAQTAKGVAVEPTVNYDKSREAQFLVVEGRGLAAAGKTADAVAAFTTARRLADDVATWQPESQTWHASATTGGPGGGSDDPGPQSGGNTAAYNPDHSGSRYKSAAIEIRAAADDALAKLAPAKP